MSEAPGIVIVGAPRSGTTLLRRLVDAHPDIACPSETYLLAACARFLHAEDFGDGMRTGVESGLSFAGVDGDEAVDRLRAFAFGLLDEIARRHGKTRWAEKTAFGAFHLDGIERVCQQHCRYVLLYRHGLDVACSTLDLVDKMQTVVTELRPYIARHARPLVAYAHAWVDVVSRMRRLERERPDQALAVRYEDLVADPKQQLERIFEFVGAATDVASLVPRAFASDPSPGLGDWKTYQKQTVDAASIGGWTSLSAVLQRALGEICNPLLVELGYDRVALPPEASAAESRRRYQLGLMVAGLNPSREAEDGDR